MTGLVAPPEWYGPSDNPHDEQFADIIEPVTLESAGDYDAVLVGESYDSAGGQRPNNWPTAVREALAVARTQHLDCGPVAPLGDLGTVEVPDGETDVVSVQKAVRDFTARVHRTDAVPVFLGGDDVLTYPNAAPLLDLGSLGVISFDAHLNCQEVGAGPARRTACRQLLDTGLDSLVVVGARHFETSTVDHDYFTDRHGHLVHPSAVEADPIGVVTDALDSLDDVDSVYARIDLDVLDVAAGGFSPRSLFRMLGHLALDDRVVGLEVVGDTASGSNDPAARTGARAIAHFMAGLGVEQ